MIVTNDCVKNDTLTFEVDGICHSISLLDKSIDDIYIILQQILDSNCCDTIINKLNVIDGKLQPIYIDVPVEVIVYKDRLVPIVTTEYVLTTTTIYVELPCDHKPVPPPKTVTITSPLPIQPPTGPGRVIPTPPVWSFPPNDNISSRWTIDGKGKPRKLSDSEVLNNITNPNARYKVPKKPYDFLPIVRKNEGRKIKKDSV